MDIKEMIGTIKDSLEILLILLTIYELIKSKKP